MAGLISPHPASAGPWPAWLWGNDALSDITLQLCTSLHRPDPAISPDTAAAGEDGPAVRPQKVPPAVESVRTYRLHALVLANSSGYFRTRILPSTGHQSGDATASMSYADQPSNSSGIAAGVGRHLLLVERLEESELDAMEAVLRHCYTGELGAAGGEEALGIALLLRSVVQADR